MAATTYSLLLVLCVAVVLLTNTPRSCVASDADPLQDFCVAANTSKPNLINGLICKPSADTVSSDFKYSGLSKPGNTSASKLGSAVTPAFVFQFPGLNTLGVGVARLDFAVGGLNPPHVHPRATELFFVLEGVFEVGFVSSNANTLYAQVVGKGELFVFPKGLLHFQRNVGHMPACGLAIFNSQNPGLQQAAKALLGSGIPETVLAQTLGIKGKLLQLLEKNQM